jgi:hypothetical protein
MNTEIKSQEAVIDAIDSDLLVYRRINQTSHKFDSAHCYTFDAIASLIHTSGPTVRRIALIDKWPLRSINRGVDELRGKDKKRSRFIVDGSFLANVQLNLQSV